MNLDWFSHISSSARIVILASKLSDERFLVAIGHNIKACRTKRKLTQEALAGKVGIDRSYLAGVELGKRNITMLSLKQIAEALGVSAGSLIKGA
jgi:predicted transcriptional regulator